MVPELIENGVYQHSWLGLSGSTLQADIAEAMDLDREQRGVLIATITPDSPSDEAGLRGSDKQFQYLGSQVLIGGDIISSIRRLLMVIPIVVVLAPIVLLFIGGPIPQIIFGGK